MKNIPCLPRIVRVAMGSALALLLLPVVQASASDAFAVRADKAKSLPVTTSIEKGEPGPQYGGPYTLAVKNTSAAALKLKAVVAQSVVSHNRPRTIELPEHTLEAGGTWKIADLAVEDKITLSAEGYEALEVKVAPAK